MTEDPSDDRTIQQLQNRLKKLKEENRKWMRLAGIDRLTQLPNSLMLYQVMLPRALHQGKPLACILFGPDGLGEINQQHGRMVGDRLVQQIGRFLKQHKESQEQLFHCDGANFALLIPDAGEEKADQRATQIKDQFKEAPFSVQNQTFPGLTCSAGIVETGDQIDKANIPAHVDQLHDDLDNRLFQAKGNGGNVVVGSSPKGQPPKGGDGQTPTPQDTPEGEKGPSEDGVLQICRRYEITCPICENKNELLRLKADICRPVETEGDGHPLRFKWGKPGFETVDPKQYFWGVCAQCGFAGEMEDADYRQAAKAIEAYRQNFQTEALEQLRTAAANGEGVTQALVEKVRDDDPFGRVLAQFHLGIWSQGLRLKMIPNNFARYYLRIGWLFRDQSTYYPEVDLDAVAGGFAPLQERWKSELPGHKEYPVVPGIALNEAEALSFSQTYFERTYELLEEATQEDELKLMRLMAEIAYRRYELTGTEEDYKAASGYFSGAMQKIMGVVSDKSIDPGMANRIKQMLDAVGERGRSLRELRQSKGGG